ncbi:putative reverse transcriptase domain-containing protein [Tanacetum coccineum]
MIMSRWITPWDSHGLPAWQSVVKPCVSCVMAALVISISVPIIPVVLAEVPIAPADPLGAPKVGAVSIISPTGVLDLVDYSSSSDSDPSEDSLHVPSELPLVSPFLCTDDSGADSESEPAEQRPERHEHAWRRVSHRSLDHHSSLDFTSDSSSSSSSSDSSSDISLGSSSDSLSDSSSVHSSGCDASESSLDSSSERSLDSSSPSVGPSRKRCRSPTTLVPSSTLVSRSIAPAALADLLPRKRFRDSYSFEVSGEEHMEIGTADAETVADLGISDGVGAPTKDGIGMGVEVATSDIREDEEEFEAEASAGGTIEIEVDPLATGGISEPTGGDAPDLEGTLYDIAHYMSEVPLDRITEFETAQRQLEAGQLVASGERAGLADRVRSLGWENLRVRALLCIERDRVDSLCRHMALSQEEFSQICRDRDDTRRRLRRTMTNTRSGMTPAAIEEMINRRVAEALETREANRNIGLGNGNDEGGNRNGTEGVVGLIRWFEKMEKIFHISNCPEKYQVKYATCTLLNSALTWWNSHKRTIGTDVAFAMSWKELMKLMAEVYCPRTEIQKMESELWNLTVKNNDLATYTQRFQELTMLCTKMVPEDEDRVEKFIGGLPDNIQGNVIAAEPTRLQDVPEGQPWAATTIKRQNVGGQNVARAYTAGKNERRVYNGPLPLCNKCKFHYEGPCIVRCGKCNKVGHLIRDCKATISPTSTQRGQNRGNKTGNKSGIGEARGKAYVLGGGDANPDSNVVTATFLLNNHYASVLFDSGADQSFVSTTFSTLLDIIPDTLDVSYVVELADERVSETNTVLRAVR